MVERSNASLAPVWLALCVVAAGCQPPPETRRFGPRDAGAEGGICPPPAPDLGPVDRLATHFAAIGDYGYDYPGSYEPRVASMIEGFHPDFIITLGDNNYTSGSAEWIDRNVGKYFHAYISPYLGDFGCGASENRFFPALGNHDWMTPGAQPYLDYFQLPGNERYYDVVQGDVHLFVLDSDPSEPDGITADSIQGQWLHAALAASTARWRIVYMHHPPYSSGPHGSTLEAQWPYREWGASLVLSGHDHTYERLEEGGLTYIVCGLGGAEIYPIDVPIAGSVSHYTTDYGALSIDADDSQLRVRFYAIGSPQPIDEVVLTSP